MDNSKYQEICRLCLAEEKAKVPIFQEKEILMKITSCLPIKVFKDDQLPKKICEECFIKVDTFYEFRNNTANAEKQLYDWLVQINSHSSTLSMSLQLHNVFVKEEKISQELRNPVEFASVNSQEVFEDCDEQEERDASSGEDDDNDNDEERRDEGEGELQPTTFVNVSLECGDEAGPSGMRDEERKEDKEMKEDPIGLPLSPIQSSSSAALVGMYKRNTDVGKISGAETQRSPEQLIETEPYRCSVCGKMFKTLKWYKRHTESHSESTCFTCDLCNKSFKHNSSLKSHFREVHSKVKLFSCLLCTYATNNKSNFASHRRIMHTDVNRSGIQCDLCEVKCFREEDIMRHKIKEHGSPRFKCVVCSKSYTSRQYLNIHQAIHQPNFKLEHQCVTCGKMFPNTGHLSNHVRRRHLGLSYECSVCKKRISSLSSLKDHMSIHTGVKPHVCDICGKAFGASKYLRIHMRSHTGERPYSCRHCGKAFTQRGSLTIHLRYHTGDRPYKCRLCLKGFVAKSLMKSHLKAHK